MVLFRKRAPSVVHWINLCTVLLDTQYLAKYNKKQLLDFFYYSPEKNKKGQDVCWDAPKMHALFV